MALLLLVSAIAWQLGGLGIPYALTYSAARAPGAARRSLESITRPIAVQAIIAALCAAVALGVLTAGRPGYVRIGATLTVLAITATIFERCGLGILQGLGRFVSFNLLRLASNTIFSCVAGILWLTGNHNFLPYAIAWSICQAIVAPVALWFARRAASAVEVDALSPPLSRAALLSFGRRSLFGGDPPVETYRIDQAAVAIFLAPSALGYYVAALAFTNLPRFVAQSFALLATPVVAGKPRHRDAVRTMWRFFWISIPFYMFLVVLLWLGAPQLVNFFFGSDFGQAAGISRILLVATALYCARRVLSDSARGAGYPTIGSIAEVASLMGVVPFFAVALPIWGLDGVAYSLIASSMIALAVLVVGLKRMTSSGQIPANWEETRADEPQGQAPAPQPSAGLAGPRRAASEGPATTISLPPQSDGDGPV
jgi:O-antigen/teichoic acid export membrane protein